MHRPSRRLRLAAVVTAAAVVASACQGDDDSRAAATIGGEPIEEPSTVTDPTESTDLAGTAAVPTTSGDTDTTEGAPTDHDDDAAPTEDPVTTLVLATRPDKSTPSVATAPPGEPSVETVYEVGTIDPALAPFIELATDDLASRLDVDRASIETLTAVLVTWPNSALGCPEPDRAYAPVLIDGAVIELGTDGLVYRYHAGGERGPFPCDRPLDPVPTPIS